MHGSPRWARRVHVHAVQRAWVDTQVPGMLYAAVDFVPAQGGRVIHVDTKPAETARWSSATSAITK